MKIAFNSTEADRKLSPNATRALFAGLRAEVMSWAIDEQAAFIEQRLSGRPGLNRWSGRLARSLVPIRETTAGGYRGGFMFLPTISAEGGQIENYAYKQEEGGPITAKGGKMLAWPVQGGPAVTQGGANRYGNSPRNYPGKLFFFKARTGNMFLAESFGRGGNKMRLVYHLAKSVEIPARLGFKAFAAEALERVKMRLAERKVRILREVAA